MDIWEATQWVNEEKKKKGKKRMYMVDDKYT